MDQAGYPSLPRDAAGTHKISRSRWFSFLVLAAANTVLLALGVGGIELIAGDWFEPFVPPAVVIVNRTFTIRQELYQPHGDIVYASDRYGLRGVKEPLDKIELVTVGGSTTNQIYITEGETWQDDLRALTGIRVANAGANGMTSFGHLVAVSEWLHRVPGLAPKFYLHFIGVNDAELGRVPRPSDMSGTNSPWLLAIRKRSAIAKSLEQLWFFLHGAREVAHGSIVPHANEKPRLRVQINSGEIENFIETVYKPNLRALLGLHHGRAETAILMSQTANPNTVRWTAEDTFVSESAASVGRFAVGLRLINAATADVCGQNPDMCIFLDLAHGVRFEADDFYDLVHTTPAGNRKIAAFLAEKLTSLQRRM